MAETGSDSWRTKCLALAQELDAREAFWKDAEKRLFKVLTRLLCALEDRRSDPPLESLRQAVRRGVLDETGLAQLEAAADALFRIVASPSIDEQSLHRPLARLLRELETFPALAEPSRQLIDSLKQGGALPEVLTGTARLLFESYVMLRQEREEIQDFLAQLTIKLQQLDAQAQNIGRVFGEKQGWNAALTAQVARLRTQTLEETSLDALKSLIVERLDSLTEQLVVICKVEAKQEAELAEQIAALTGRVAELEQETQDLRRRLKAAQQQARYDPVTGLPNRQAVDERLTQEFSRWQRFRQPLSLLLWDIDHFKQINDRFGHQAGDKILRVVAQTLRGGIREVDFVGRYGGEEFVMLLPGTDLEGALKVAEKLREAVKGCGFNSRGKPVPVTISCGLSGARPGDTQASLFERADQALYQAKQTGRDRCVSV
ncbi:hypothetical protein JCM13664_06050 [Methylothermus subterraneus]